MPKQNIIATNFTSGEVSPLVRGRVDAQKYANGLETCENFIVRPQGPIWRRSGTKYLGVTKHPTQKSILVPFEYSDTKGYVLEFGVGYIHVWDNDVKLCQNTASLKTSNLGKKQVSDFNVYNNSGLVQVGMNSASLPSISTTKHYSSTGTLRATSQSPHGYRTGSIARFNLAKGKAITGAANNGSGKIRITSASHGLNDGDTVWIQSIVGTIEANDQQWYVTGKTTNTFDLQGSSFSNAYVSGGEWFTAIGDAVSSVSADAGTGYCKISFGLGTYSTGARIKIYGVGGTTEANGYWTVYSGGSGEVVIPVKYVNAYTSGGFAAVFVQTSHTNVSTTRVNDYTLEFPSLSSENYYQSDYLFVRSSGVIAGDRFQFYGASNVPEVSNKQLIAHSHNGYSGDTLYELFTTNAPRITSTTTTIDPAYIYTIPIEISTDYGFYPQKKISSIANSSGQILINLNSHGFSTGDTIEINKSENAADGTWVITVVNSNSFKLNSSVYVSASTSGYARKKATDSESELFNLRFVQSADVLYVMHPDHPVCKLTRLANEGNADDWLFAQVDFKDGPYLPLQNLAPTWDETTPANGSTFADVYFELSSYTHTATVTSATAFAAGAGTYSDDASKYIEYREGDQWRLAQLPSTLAKSATTETVTIIDNVLLHLDESIKFTGTKRVKNKFGKTQTIVYNAGSPNLTPTVPGAAKQSKVDPNNYLESSVDYNAGTTGNLSSEFSNTFSQSDVGKYVRFFDKGTHGSAGSALSATNQKPAWAQIARVNKGKSGKECTHDQPVTMASNNATGKFEITNHSRTATLKAYKSGATFAAFKATDVNRLFRIGWGGRWTWGKITAFTSTSQVSVSLYEDVPRDPHNAANLAGATNGGMTSASTTGRSYDWRMGSWSETTGYPSCGVFHEQRLWFGRTDTEPQTIWGSIAGDFENFSPTELDSAVLEDNAIGFTIASTKANPIKWMISGPAITVGTTGGEWQVKSSSVSSEPITPLNIVVVPHTSHGSNNKVQPIRLGNSVMFADRPGNRIRELIYDFSVDALVSKDLTYLSEHMLREGTGAIYSAYQQEPNNICWYVLNDGTLAAVTINKDQEIVAWHHHSISNGTSDAVIESIAVIPNSDSSKDNVYMVVKRGNNRYVELLQNDFYPNGTNRKGMAYLDGSVIFSGTDFSGTVVAGLHHLEGKIVTVTIDGTELGTYTVSGGSITIASQTSKELVVGVPYTSTAKSLPPEGGSAFGVSQGKIKKIAKYNVRLLNSLALDYGFNANGQSLNSITNLHEDGSIANTNFYTGTKELVPNNPYDAESQWTLSTSKPYPLNILSVTMTVEAGE